MNENNYLALIFYHKYAEGIMRQIYIEFWRQSHTTPFIIALDGDKKKNKRLNISCSLFIYRRLDRRITINSYLNNLLMCISPCLSNTLPSIRFYQHMTQTVNLLMLESMRYNDILPRILHIRKWVFFCHILCILKVSM